MNLYYRAKHEKQALSKRIGIFIGGGSFGGIERVLLNLAFELSASGQKIDLIFTKNSKCSINQKYRKNGLKIIKIGVNRIRWSVFGIIKYLKSNKPDIIISGAPSNNIIVIIAKYLSRSKTKIVVGIHCIFSETRKENIISWIIYLLVTIFYRYADKIIAGTRYAAEDFSKVTGIPIKKIDVIYNPSISKSIIEESNRPIVHPWFIKKEYPIIMGVGRLEVEKNFQLLVKAFAKVIKHRKAYLVLLGEGKEQKKIEDLIEQLKIWQFVSMEGFVSNPYPYMAKASVIVVPSLHEQFSIVLAEAMALGISTVATDCPGGIREVLDIGKYGKIVESENEDALAKGIIEMLDNPINPNILMERSKIFSAEKIAREYLALLSDL